MRYLKNLFFNIFIAFMSLHLFDGIMVANVTKLPHIGGDLYFAAGLGFLNSLIYPLLSLSQGRFLALRIAVIAAVLNFAAYGALKILPLGIALSSFRGYWMGALMATIGSFLANFFEKKPPEPNIDLPEIESSDLFKDSYTNDQK